jgi:predicted trehalose synthase
MLRFLSDKGYPNIARLGGWYQYEGELMDATFGVVQRFVPTRRDGWELALDELGTDPDRFVARLRDLGAVIGRCIRSWPRTPATPPSPLRSPPTSRWRF